MSPTTWAKRAATALVLHLALLSAWPLVRPLYAPAWRAGVEFVLGFLAPLPGTFTIRLAPGEGGPLARELVRMDTVVGMRPANVEGGGDAAFGASSFFHGYQPLCVFLALFLGVLRGPWATRRGPFWVGLLLLHAGLVLRFLPALYHCLSKCAIDGEPLLALGAEGERALRLLARFTWEEMSLNCLGPVLLFAFVFGARSRGEAEPVAGA